MSLTASLQTAVSGLQAAQVGLRTVSDNIANVNTPGYVRKTVDQQQLVAAGKGMGVQILGVRRVTDQYLQLASLSASSDSGKWAAVSQYMDNAQGLFGDPSGDSSFFSRLDDIWASFAAAANNPSSSLSRSEAISNVEDFLNEASRINGQLAELGGTVDAAATADVARANDLLAQINRMNADITRAKLSGGDASGSENAQSQLIDELSNLMNIRVQQREQGGVTIRSQEGVMLSGEGAATLVYNRTDSTRGYISAVSPTGGPPTDITVSSGEIRGLLDLRDEELPGLASQLGEFMTRTAEAINAAHNASSSVPAPASLTGRNTGLDQASAIGGFSGVATVAITNAQGVVQRTVAIDFTANTLSVNGGGATAFTDATFAADLSTALGAFGSASFNGGTLSINAAGAGNGVAISEGTSQNAGKGFSHFMGLNDLIRSNGTTSYETGLVGTSPHGFLAGGVLNLRVADADGKPLRDVSISPTAGGDMNSLLAQLNNATTGVGLYGQYALDSKGALVFTASQPLNANISVVNDTTQRGTNGRSVSELFGIGAAQRGTRASNFYVDTTITSDPTKLAIAKLDLTVAAGQPALRPGDGTGGATIAAAGDSVLSFQAAGGLGAVTMTIARYAAEFGGSIGRNAASADTRQKSADAVKTEADQRRQSVESVNIDEELVRLTTYQQAFNASARMIQAAKDMFDVLSDIV